MFPELQADPGPLSDGELSLALLQRVPGDPQRGFVPAYAFGLLVDGAPAGHLNLRIGATEHLILYAGHIGYGVEPAYRGHHYAERACRLVFPLARACGLRTIWITCNPDNIPSRRTCERLGGILAGIVAVPPDTDMYRRGDTHKCRYRIDLPPEPG